ncbi:protein of unknown function DUF4116 containing protein [Nitzschia inconspicua]|uniref:DUF4116 domain-containing protein n=1 Tax=Nitzschia inconspicua TaxID=303405 RepID=A0A9K3K4U6_9STRA|nr:protein of unknown function DUF4116 containing protein [Nitzschia inconspicua]KAG7348672.1 protein of unknown function DUF4116 containing protein [Nitzschia inconspicua]
MESEMESEREIMSTSVQATTPSTTSSQQQQQQQQSRSNSCRRHHLKAPPTNSFNVLSQQDKQRARRLIEKEGQAKTIWEHLPEVWKHDKELILAALNNHAAELPCKSQFERTFPQSLRFDKDIVLAFCCRPDFSKKRRNNNNNQQQQHYNNRYNSSSNKEKEDTDNDDNDDDEEEEDRGLYFERHLFVPGCLTNDKDVMMAYCRKIPRSLQDCSEELCNDRDIVITAITHCGGLELQYASVQLQQDMDIVKLACTNHGRAIEFCPLLSSTRHTLLHDRNFMLQVVLNNPGGGPMWKLLPLHMKNNDHELVLQALTNGLLLRDVPKQYIRLEFLIQALRRNPSLYLQLKYLKVHTPSDIIYHNNTSSSTTFTSTTTTATTNIKGWNQHPTLAFEAIISQRSTPQVHTAALGEEGCPTLKDNRQVVLAICQRGSKEMLQDILGTSTTSNNNTNHQEHENNNNNDDDHNHDDAALAAIIHFNNNNNNNNNNMAVPPFPAIHPNNHHHNIINNNDVVNILPPVPNLAAAAAANPIHRRHDRDRTAASLFRPQPPQIQPTTATTVVVPPRSRFCDDMDIMKLAVQRDPSFFSVASLRLQAEPELILFSITRKTAWDTLKTVPWSIRQDHPEITVKAIELCDELNLRYLPSHIPEELWINHRDICMAWIRRGQPILDVFERILQNDIEMALLVAKHNWSQFHKVGDRFLADRDFILQAVQCDGRVLQFANQTLRQDVHVMIVAAANYYNNTPISPVNVITQKFCEIMNMDVLKHEIQRLLHLHDIFLYQFLRGITVKTPRLAPALRSQLTMLDRGVETSQALKQLIAQYLGVPIGTTLSVLRKADDNVTLTERSLEEYNATWGRTERNNDDDNNNNNNNNNVDINIISNNNDDDDYDDNTARMAYRNFRRMARRHDTNMELMNDNNPNDNDDDDDDHGGGPVDDNGPRDGIQQTTTTNDDDVDDDDNHNNDNNNNDTSNGGGYLARLTTRIRTTQMGMTPAVMDDNADRHRTSYVTRMDVRLGRRMLDDHDSSTDETRREEMRRIVRTDRETAFTAMRIRHEDRRRHLRQMMADVETTHREAAEQNEEHVHRRRPEETIRRLEEQDTTMAIANQYCNIPLERRGTGRDDQGSIGSFFAASNNNLPTPAARAVHRPIGATFLFRPTPDRPNYERRIDWNARTNTQQQQQQQQQQRHQERDDRERLWAAERQRNQEDMLARLEARNARSRAAERRRRRRQVQDVVHRNGGDDDDDDDDTPPPLMQYDPPVDFFGLAQVDDGTDTDLVSDPDDYS